MTYLARYLRGGPISNSRIVKIQDSEVTFNYGRKKPEFMTLSIDEFIERFLQHVPEPNAILVRSYGLVLPGQKARTGKLPRHAGAGAFRRTRSDPMAGLLQRQQQPPGALSLLR